MQKEYKAQFFDHLLDNIRQLQGGLTTKDGSLTKSLKNTCLFARALHNTFDDMHDTAGMLLMVAGCDYSPLENK